MTGTIKDFNGTIWDRDIPAIVTGLKEKGIKEFTISNTASGLLKTLAIFEANGAKVQGLTSIKGDYLDTQTGELVTIPAMLMRIG